MNESSPDPSPDTTDDAVLLERAEEFYGEERLLKAAEVLKQVKDKDNCLTDRHKRILRWADLIESGIDNLLQDPERDGSPWIKQREQHGHRDFLVFYQLTDNNKLIARIDCAFESSLLVPLLSVFNESELFSSWMPCWERPVRLGISRSEKLKDKGRGKQIIRVTTSLAWPFADREVVFRVMAADAIEEDRSCIAIQAVSQTSDDDPVIPEATREAVRVDFSNFMLIQACPPDHPCVARSKHHSNDKDHEPLILMNLTLEVDPHLGVVPQSVQNFVTRTVIGRLWLALLHVAEDVRDGKRPRHKEAIDAKPELYDWIKERVGVMIENLGKEKEKLGCEPSM